MNFFIIHGSHESPISHWFPWLKQQLSRYGRVIVPRFPTPNNQNLRDWLSHFPYSIEHSIIIAHSLGVLFSLNLLQQKEKAIACFFVSGFHKPVGKYFDEYNSSFLTNFDFKKIRNNCKAFYNFYSNNDPYVPEQISQELGSLLYAQQFLIEHAGHFRKKDGYSSFPLLLTTIERHLNSKNIR